MLHLPSFLLRSVHQPFVRSFARRAAAGLLGGLSLSLLPQSLPFGLLSISGGAAQAQETQPAPTVRYARGEDVELAEIVDEWRGYYADVPVYLCTCQEATCDQTQQWPYRTFDQYQLGVALGPTNGKIAEASGATCFDIADGSTPEKPRSFSAAERDPNEPRAALPPTTLPTRRPSPAPVSPAPTSSAPTRPVSRAAAPVAPPAAPATPPTQPAPVRPVAPPPSADLRPAPATPVQVAASQLPVASAINNGAAIKLDWPSGASNVIDVASSRWNVTVLDATDCESLSQVEQKTLEAQRVVGTPVVDSATGNVAVPVLLDSCVDVDQSAVFVLDVNEGGGYSLYRTQLPGDRTFPTEFSTYALSSIDDLRYWNGSLFVNQSTATGAESVVIFRPSRTPAGEYAGCGVTRGGEGAALLCPDTTD